MRLILALILVAVIGVLAYIRLAPSDPDHWNVDPLTATSPAPGGVLMLPEGGDMTSPVFSMTPPELLTAFDRIARGTPRTSVLAGSVEAGRITYIVRSRVFGFPDYVTVAAVPADDGAQLAVLSRLRFGSSDLGVNKARLEGWLAQLAG
ncbi:MAG: DUF1499 domain-containing protein [Pseudomonadota bacterium]